MKYLIGAAAGLVWGSLAALLNAFITKKALDKGNDKLLLASNALRMLVDVAALGLVLCVPAAVWSLARGLWCNTLFMGYLAYLNFHAVGRK